MKARSLTIAALAFVLLTSCAPETNDTSLTDASTPTDTDVASDPEADPASDLDSDQNDLSDTPLDGNVEDTGALGDTPMTSDVDAASDANATDTTDASSDADIANNPDVTVRPSIVVTAPASGTYTMGQTLDVAWSTTNADEVTLSLVTAAEPSAEGDDGVMLLGLFSAPALTTTYLWDVPITLEPNDYRVRARATSTSGMSSVACSATFTLVQPLGCTELGCAAQNRACSTDS